jgi:glutathione S-transferase
MKLYLHPASPNCFSVVLTAKLVSIPLETEIVDVSKGAHRIPEYLAINPNGAVPALRDGDFVLWESNAINQYLAGKKADQPVWSDDPRVRADITRWQLWAAAQWNPALQPYLWENCFKAQLGFGEPDLAALDKASQNLHRYATVLNGHLAGRDYLVGRQLTLADIAAGCHLMYARQGRVPLAEYPNIRRWLTDLERLPEWQSALPISG